MSNEVDSKFSYDITVKFDHENAHFSKMGNKIKKIVCSGCYELTIIAPIGSIHQEYLTASIAATNPTELVITSKK